MKYLSIIRIDHWIKNIFMIPGIMMGFIFSNILASQELFIDIILGVFATCLVASANYVINEWLDKDFDKFHPIKKNRSSVNQNLNSNIVYALYSLLLAMGLSISYFCSVEFLAVQLLLAVMGVIYNVPPLRAKDIAYIDVATESVNNPIRFLLGWMLVTTTVIPPSSILIAYWAGGGFLMAIKRYAEFKKIGDKELAIKYRKSFSGYSETNLLGSAFFYATLSAFFLGVFLIRYRVEYLLIFPLFSFLFTYYFTLGLRPNSPVQYPERLYLDIKLTLVVALILILFIVFTWMDLPFIHFILERS